MLITFHSGAAADVIMFGDAARRLLSTLGKDPDDAQGIVTVEQLPGAIARLEAAIAAEKAQREAASEDDDEEDEDAPRGMAAPVGFAQRAWPLLEMMRYSLAEDTPVTWDT